MILKKAIALVFAIASKISFLPLQILYPNTNLTEDNCSFVAAAPHRRTTDKIAFIRDVFQTTDQLETNLLLWEPLGNYILDLDNFP